MGKRASVGYLVGMTPSARFVCFAGCGERYPLDAIVYRCQRCGSLLDVEHDEEALAERSPEDWKSLFDARLRGGRWPEASGVWGKREWVLPELDPSSVVSFAEGGSALVRAERYGRAIGLDDVWIKQCGASHTGSFKDLGMTVLVSAVREANRRARLAGREAPIRAIACASTGDTSASLAAYCAATELSAIVLLPKDKVSLAQLAQPLAHGALVLSLDTDFDGAMALVRELTADGSIYLANSMNSLRIEGQKTVGVELVQQLGWEVPDWIVLPGGNLGNAYALGKGLLLMRRLGLIERLPRLAVAQAERANPLYRAYRTGFSRYAPIEAKKTAASAIQIGAPVSIDRAIFALRALDGVVEEASERELAEAAIRADRAGLYVCPQTAVALAALEKLARAGTVRRGERVVVVSTASALKFTEFKLAAADAVGEGARALAPNRPRELPASLDAVRAAIDQRLEERARA